MKTINKIIILTFGLAGFMSCKKIKQIKPIKVNFKVVNAVTKQGYAHVDYEVVEYEKVNKILTPDKERQFLTGSTDANGEAYIEFKRAISNKLYYGLRVYEQSLPSDSKASSIGWGLEDKTEQDITCYVGEVVDNVDLHIKNINCFDNNDEVYIDLQTEGEYFGGKKFIELNYSGCIDLDTTFSFRTDFYPYTLTVTRNGVTTTIQDTLAVAPDTDTLEIFY